MSEELYQRQGSEATNAPQPAPPGLPYSESPYYEYPVNGPPPPFVTAPERGAAHPPRQARAKRPRSTGKIILLVVLALVVIAGGTGLFFVIYNQQVTANNARATASSINGVTATFVSAQGTIDARLHGAETATASFDAANANPYPPGGGTLALYSPLNTSANDVTWGVDPGTCDFINGSYHVITTGGKYIQECGGGSGFTNFTVETQMTILRGLGGGFILRKDAANDMYLFEIDYNGAYSLSKYMNYQYTQTLVEGLSPAFHPGINQMNLIAIVAIGDTFTLYINHQQVGKTHDNAISEGGLYLAAVPYSIRAEVAFNNLRAWTFS